MSTIWNPVYLTSHNVLSRCRVTAVNNVALAQINGTILGLKPRRTEGQLPAR